MSKIDGYECEKCKVLMKQDDKRLRTVVGHIYSGITGGPITAGEKKDKDVEKHYCVACLISIIKIDAIRKAL